jgi:hypothetical protein
MTDAIIRELYNDRLAAWCTAEGYGLDAEGVTFEQELPGAYIVQSMFPSRLRSLDLNGAHRLYMGTYQMDICHPYGSGVAPVDAIADEIEALFPQGLTLTSGTLSVQIIEPCGRYKAIKRDSWLVMPMRFMYRADVSL